MNGNIKLVSLFIIMLAFLSCGGSDITPPSDNHQPEQPAPNPSFDITQMQGKREGLAKISLMPGGKRNITEVGEVLVLPIEGATNKLQFSFSRPELALGGSEASNFKEADQKCSFALGKYKPVNGSLEGDNIPKFIREWFPDVVLTKVEFGEFVSKDGGIYSLDKETISLTYSTKLLLHYVGGEGPLRDHSLEFAYSNLIKKD